MHWTLLCPSRVSLTLGMGARRGSCRREWILSAKSSCSPPSCSRARRTASMQAVFTPPPGSICVHCRWAHAVLGVC